MAKASLIAKIDREIVREVYSFREQYGLEFDAAVEKLIRLGLGKRVVLEAKQQKKAKSVVESAADRSMTSARRKEFERWSR